jgi:GNAT superfamily N-acetyltransferase
MRSEVEVRCGGAGELAACAAIQNAWIDATEWMVRVHPAGDMLRHYREDLLPTCALLVAGRGPDGFAFVGPDGEIPAFYVAEGARGAGLGAALMGAAKALRPGGLTLWTFEANAGARRFYAREGFREVGRTPGANEEGLPDVLLAWRGSA